MRKAPKHLNSAKAAFKIQPLPDSLQTEVGRHFHVVTQATVLAYARHNYSNYDTVLKTYHLNTKAYEKFKQHACGKLLSAYQKWLDKRLEKKILALESED